MDVTRTEEEQIEALKKWWSDNGWALVGGVVIGLGAIFGWRGWQNHQALQAEVASDIYVDLVVEMREQRFEPARKFAEQLIQDYDSTSYASFATLMLAKIETEAGNTEAAIKHLQTVMDETGEAALKQIARVRLARLLLDSDKPDEALAMLEAGKPGKFSVAYQELKGDIYIRLGRKDDAHAAYQTALAAVKTNIKEGSLLQLKFDNSKSQD
ncbi:MAG: tetratricopeptide repeat protein [Gammaproteobacteria bacterium]|nr:tetratricopeptide repeat protein [Gammaproteobacteria bacterium]NIN62773.1 tetratricopeptide repeat protein [Gammaproteobacteria bacterium]NIO63754.1 tetratricopeptide repeat protein [Gammaproteobacteria bacterium]NIP50132.1 tetratricopeptide repeat protein [Gammaproteobacteria bacterium]NIQ12350.1 tetratricopeptide repeat protein [Gammaproteobacteria bacterium]